MVSFLRLMRFFIQKIVLKKAKIRKQLSKVDVMDDKNMKLKITTSCEMAWKKVTGNLHDGLKNFLVSFLRSMIITKIQERSLLSKKLVLFAASLDPIMMVHVDIETLLPLFAGIISIMLKNNRFCSKECDSAKDQFEKVIKKVVLCNKEEFSNFNFKVSRVDDFFGYHIPAKSYP